MTNDQATTTCRHNKPIQFELIDGYPNIHDAIAMALNHGKRICSCCLDLVPDDLEYVDACLDCR